MRRLSLGLLLVLALAAGLLVVASHTGYAAQDRDSVLAGASGAHWAGTDALGRDRAVRCAAALLLGLAGAMAAAAVTTAIAAAVGTCAASLPPAAGKSVMLISDVVLTLPWLYLLMMVRSALPLNTSPMQSYVVTFAILAGLGWPICARAVYRGTLKLQRSDWMIHGRASGMRPAQLVRLHVLPHLRALLLPQFLVSIPVFLVAEANLGTLGLGLAEPLPSWGGMLLELDNSALLARSHWVYLPVMLLVTVLLLLETIAQPTGETR